MSLFGADAATPTLFSGSAPADDGPGVILSSRLSTLVAQGKTGGEGEERTIFFIFC